MNKVYLSGIIVENPTLVTTEQGATHLILSVSVSHRNKMGIKSELYRVNAGTTPRSGETQIFGAGSRSWYRDT